MNGKIKELVEQANISEIIDDSYLERGDWEIFIDKLVTLIVKECLSIMNGCDGDIDYAIYITSKRFGIEE